MTRLALATIGFVLLLNFPAAADLADARSLYGEQRYEEAAQRFLPLAEAGDAEAQFYLGFMYASGRGVEQSNIDSVRWYRRAALQDHSGAAYNLALIYRDGRGVPQNHEEALALFRQAAELGERGALNEVGLAYLRGDGTEIDLAEAARWFRRAGDQGNIAAMPNLGRLLAGEWGDDLVDRPESVFWLRLAEIHGERSDRDGDRGIAADARDDRERLLAEMTPEEIEDAIERVQLLFPGDDAIVAPATTDG